MAKHALVIPDMHVGFRRATNGNLTPLHDESALKAALKMARQIRPSEVVMLGDNLDLAAWSSKFVPTPDLRETTQASLECLRDFLVALRKAVGPKCRLTYLEGNHEARIGKLLLVVAGEAYGLSPAGSDVPALSVPGLLRLADKDLRINYLGPYGATYWLWGKVECTHGDLIRKRGGHTVGARLVEHPNHQTFGHIHRCELAGRTLHGASGPHTVWAMSPGTLARLDGVVPAGTAHVDWQQGLGLITLDGEDIAMFLIPITNGKAMLPGGLKPMMDLDDGIDDEKVVTKLAEPEPKDADRFRELQWVETLPQVWEQRHVPVQQDDAILGINLTDVLS